MLIHEFFLRDGEGTEFITKRIFILSRQLVYKGGVITATVKAHSTDYIPQTFNDHLKNNDWQLVSNCMKSRDGNILQ